jgi:hypothetical protein
MVELNGLGRWDRADMVPVGSGGLDPQVRKGDDREAGMNASHPKGT